MPTPNTMQDLLGNAIDISASVDPASLVGQSARLNVQPAISAGVDIDQYLGPWAIDPVRGMQILGMVQGMNLGAHIQANRESGTPSPLSAQGRNKAMKHGRMQVGVVELQGALTKRGSSLGGGMDSLLATGRNIDMMAANDEVDAIVLVIDSPGGTVAGTQELAGRILKARSRKPVVCWVRDLAASAAFWLASQCDAVYCNVPTAMIGSIGTYIGLYDFSKWAEEQGIEAVVVRARDEHEGNVKAMGFPGTKITDEHRAYLMEIVNASQDHFSAAISNGRGMKLKAVEELATGRVWQADNPAAQPLIDGVADWDQVIEAAVELASKPRSSRSSVHLARSTSPTSRTFLNAFSAPSADLPAALQAIKSLRLNSTNQPESVGSDLSETPDPSGSITQESNTMPTDNTSTDQASNTSTLEAGTSNQPAPNASGNGAAGGGTGQQSSAPASTQSADGNKPATLAQLKEAFPNAEASFYVNQLDQGATIDQAYRANSDLMQAKLDAEKARADAAEAKSKKPGLTQPLGDGGGGPSLESTGDAIDDFKSEIAKLTATGMKEHDAAAKVCRDQPELRIRYVAATNVKLGRSKQAQDFLNDNAA